MLLPLSNSSNERLQKNFNSFKDKLPVTEKLSRGIFSLPLYPEIEKEI